MPYFLKSGSTYRVATKESMDLHETLPAANYIIEADAMGNLFLNTIDSFKLPSKIYGDATKNAKRIITTFLDRDVSTGVMLNGEKGSGKTLLSKALSIDLAARGIPTIVINSPWRGDGFNQLLQHIEQPCMVLFDEFEKVYEPEQQEQILTLLDGVFGSKKLFVLTCNDKWRVDQHMRNRPGRIYYMIDYKGLDVNFISEYCNDTLKEKQHIQKICGISGLFSEFNFDMLKALVEEMNRYGEEPQQALSLLNAKPEFSSACKYDVSFTFNNKPVPDVNPSEYKGNPLTSGIHLEWDEDPTSDDSNTWKTMQFPVESLIHVDALTGKFTFESQGGRVILTKQKEKTYDYYGAF